VEESKKLVENPLNDEAKKLLVETNFEFQSQTCHSYWEFWNWVCEFWVWARQAKHEIF